jgi:hypothetical protein
MQTKKPQKILKRGGIFQTGEPGKYLLAVFNGVKNLAGSLDPLMLQMNHDTKEVFSLNRKTII